MEKRRDPEYKRSMLSSDQIRVFLTIVEKGSFSAAGLTLQRSQTAISYAIRSLETQLGVVLFERVGRRPVLTPAGSALIVEGQKVANSLQAMASRAKAIAQGVETELSIAVDAYFPPQMLIEPMRAFAEAYPDVHVSLKTAMIGDALGDVAERRSTLGIVSHVASSGSVFQQIPIVMLPVHILPVASIDHPLARSEAEVSLVQLGEHIQIVSTLNLPRAEGVFSPRLWHCNDLATQRAMMLSGLGWTALPEHLVADDLAAGRIRILRLVSWSQPDRTNIEMSLVHLAGVRLGPAARWIVECLTQASA